MQCISAPAEHICPCHPCIHRREPLLVRLYERHTKLAVKLVKKHDSSSTGISDCTSSTTAALPACRYSNFPVISPACQYTTGSVGPSDRLLLMDCMGWTACASPSNWYRYVHTGTPYIHRSRSHLPVPSVTCDDYSIHNLPCRYLLRFLAAHL